MSSAGFGSWQFSDAVIPKVEEFSALFHHQEHNLENLSPWGILFGSKDLPPLTPQQLPAMEWSDDESDDETEVNMPAVPAPNAKRRENQVKERLPISELEQQQLTVMETNTTNEQNQLPMKELNVLHANQLDESALLPPSQQTFVEFQGCTEDDSIAEQVDLLESGESEIDLTTLPTAAAIEVFRGLTDKGLPHAVEAVCAMKPTDQARFNGIIITHLLLKRMQESDVRCTRQVLSAFSQFISCCPVLGCQQLLAPLIVTTPPQHTDAVIHLLMQIKQQPQKDLILKALVESLPSMNQSHLVIFLMLIGPSANLTSKVKQQLMKILSESADKFPKDLQFGKLLLHVIPLVSTLPDLKEQLTTIVNRHNSLVKNNLLKLLCK